MEAVPLPTSASDDWSDPLRQSLELQRGRVRDFLAAQRERWEHTESQLRAEIAALTAELERCRAEAEAVAERSAQCDQRAKEIGLSEAKLTGDRARFQEERAALNAARRQQVADQKRLAARSSQLETRQAALENRERELAAREADTEARRRLIGRRLRDQHAAQLQEIERRRAELAQQRSAELGQELQTSRHCDTQLAAETEASSPREAELLAMAESLRDTCEQLKQELAQAEQRNKLLASQSATPAAGMAGPGGKLDWEAEKRRILAALESDSPEDNPRSAAERLEMAEVVRTTDQMLQEKDSLLAQKCREIERLLAQQSDRNEQAAAAVGTAKRDEILDRDAVIREERETLKRLQEQCREKLREGEIQISLERAKIARQQADIQEKLRAIEAQSGQTDGSNDTSSTGKPVRGRWLARLGLKEHEEET
jgi:hypothetical protein